MNVNNLYEPNFGELSMRCDNNCNLLGKCVERLDEVYDDDDDDLSVLSMGSVCKSQQCEPELPNEEMTEEDARKIERWTRIREDGFEMINGIKYTETGSVIYSDYDYLLDEEEDAPEYEGTTSEIAVKTHGDLMRKEARLRMECNPEAYEGLPIQDEYEDEDFEWDAEGAFEEWQARIAIRHDIYLANGGITNEEAADYIKRKL